MDYLALIYLVVAAWVLFRTLEPIEVPEGYTICADGKIRKIHTLECDCEYCQTRREIIRRWQEAERREMFKYNIVD